MSRHVHLEALRKKLAKLAPAGNVESLAQVRPAKAMNESASEGHESNTSSGDTLDRLITRSDDQSQNADATALRKLANGDFDDLSPREQLQLEAIVEEEGRPVSFIRGGIF